eukprot:3663490-Prymnesium_polylepis.1
MLLFGIGIGLSCVVVNEFCRNHVLQGGTMISFVAIAIPDLVMSIVYFLFTFINLLNGKEMGEGACQVFSVFTHMVVFATFFGPAIVATITSLSLIRACRGRRWRTSVWLQATYLTTPWLIGLVVALLSQADG